MILQIPFSVLASWMLAWWLLSPVPPFSAACPTHAAQVSWLTHTHHAPVWVLLLAPAQMATGFILMRQRNLSEVTGKEYQMNWVPKKVGYTGVQDQSRYNVLRKMAEPYQIADRHLRSQTVQQTEEGWWSNKDYP